MDTDFAKRLKLLRKTKNVTQKEISYATKIDRSNIANYENGKRFPPIETLVRISEYYNVTIDFLLFGENSRGNKDLQNELTELVAAESKYNELLTERDTQLLVMREYVQKLRKYNDFLEEKIEKISGRLEENVR